MKKIIVFTIILLGLAACSVPQSQAESDPAAIDLPEAGLPNPASVYCQQNGYKHEIRTADDGSQYGICIFPDSSTCDEWAYFRGECGPAGQNTPPPASTATPASGGYLQPGATEAITDWWGVIKSTEPGAQYDDFFERQDLGVILDFGIESMDPAVAAQIKALRDSGKIVHLFGTLVNNMPDCNGSQIQVERIEVEG